MEKLGRFLGAFLSIMLFMGICSIAEEITLTTYYPAPYGAYNELSVSQAVSTDNTTNALAVSSTDDDTLAPIISASARLNGMLLGSNNATASYYILNVSSGSPLTSRFYVRNDGYVGIGTTSPSVELEVSGTVNATAYSVGNPATPGAAGVTTINYLRPDTSTGTITVINGIVTAIN
ncbi:MAG: hypothetical protein KKD90_01655 [Candidatus Omnitrophica bacterium]|nr:hypothetical protein [Candidatus Omnitrophota bacterium]MBU4149858.1 hypothetical protein [Candidatus Omnitrophota bacterium]